MPKSEARKFRQRSSTKTAIVLLHGFSGDADKTWGQFPRFLVDAPRLKGWGVWSLGFPTSLYPEIRGFWQADPGIELIAKELRTQCAKGGLAQYKRLVIIAHSMGGLVAQRAIVDFPEVAERVDALFLFGVPSLGLAKARIFRLLKLQVKDMARGGTFITDLRKRWSALYPDNSEPFELHAIAGNRDQFVPPSSSLEAFPRAHHYSLPGQHVSMVKPTSASDECVQFVINGICRRAPGATGWSSDQAAVERGEFQLAIKRLLPRARELTGDSLVDLALALDASGKRKEAIRVLEEHPSPSTDALGALGGRYKRLWLLDGTVADVERAYDLYSRALEASQAKDDSAQVFYHAINLAFIELVHFKRRAAAKKLAQRALDACQRAEIKDLWNFATQGEAHLYLGDAANAVRAYADALRLEPQPRQIESVQVQAMLAAEKSLGERPKPLTSLFERAEG